MASPASHTSLNSGFRVFFFTAVLCLDFLSTSGFRYLELQPINRQREDTEHTWSQQGLEERDSQASCSS